MTESIFTHTRSTQQEIIARAVDAAMASGATYADARLSHNEILSWGRPRLTPFRSENMAFGVRALYQGYWGFAASPVWSMDEATRLGQAAVRQAKVNVLGRERITELAPVEISSGHWETPIKDDPFQMDFGEIRDFAEGLNSFTRALPPLTSKYSAGMGRFEFRFSRIKKAFGSSVDQFTTQTLYDSSAECLLYLVNMTNTGLKTFVSIEDFSPAGLGFEYFRDRPFREYVRMAYEEAVQDIELPKKPIDPGRYRVLIDQGGVAGLLHGSIGSATEIDRVFGFEANAGGTSFITEPQTMLGALKIGAPLLNVWGDRATVGSVGHVRWDDEGVTPTRVDLVKDGILTNLQTNREGASWLKAHYERTQQPVRSSGSANAPSAMDVQLVHHADLHLEPEASSATRDDLRASLDKGIELRLPETSMDFQQATGWSRDGRAYEIRNGKRVARLISTGMLFRTPELWSNLVQIGGRDSVKYYGLFSKKGQPEQAVASGVYAPPCVFKDMTMIDITRKA